MTTVKIVLAVISILTIAILSDTVVINFILGSGFDFSVSTSLFRIKKRKNRKNKSDRPRFLPHFLPLHSTFKHLLSKSKVEFVSISRSSDDLPFVPLITAQLTTVTLGTLIKGYSREFSFREIKNDTIERPSHYIFISTQMINLVISLIIFTHHIIKAKLKRRYKGVR